MRSNPLNAAPAQDRTGTGAAAGANLRAAAIMVGATASFCVNDVFVKSLSARLPIGEIVAVRGLFVVLLMLALLPRVGLPIGRPDRYTLLRAAAELAVTLGFLTALKTLPLADTYTLYYAAPLMLTAAAALLLGERVGPRRWAAVGAGFLGVLVVLGLPANWQLASFFAILAAACSVVRDISTRWIAPDVGSGTVALTTAALITVAGGATAAGSLVPLAWSDIALCALAALGAAVGYLGFVTALRTGEMSFIATFRYSGIPIAMLLGFTIWAEVPSLQMLLGSALIMGSGIYILLRERRNARAARNLASVPPAGGPADDGLPR